MIPLFFLSLFITTTIGIPQDDGTYDLEWQLSIYPEHELNLYVENCPFFTAGCTNMEKKHIWLYGPLMNAIPWYGGQTILNHELLHARGLNHDQIKECCPNKIVAQYWDNISPYEYKSPKLLASIEHYKGQVTK